MNELHARIIGKLIDTIGQIISIKITQPDYSKYEKIIEEIYGKHPEIKTKEKREPEEKPKEITKRIEGAEEIFEGTACLACSKNHISTVSAALNEAVRFARSEPIDHPEIVRRIGIALDELNIMERIDLAPDKIINLSGEDKEIADWLLSKSRELRHMIDAIKTKEDLEKAAAFAAKVRDEFLEKLFNISALREKKDELKKQICEGLPEEDKKKCIEAIESL